MIDFRGTMDASAFVSKEQWDEILARNGCDEVIVFPSVTFCTELFPFALFFWGWEKKRKDLKGQLLS